ncbi:hypothetical protein [Devosia sp.]|uniref:hypothetical protein n=1 Tax=Devosia sp. TaxID=1871048 RepID=UPI001ACB2100|nr:hypothetical protein [Devosia sp.]MBN9308380.1 hypothetical protein [Devosia sp.]
MGLAGTALGLGTGLGLLPATTAWHRPGALIDADLAGGRYLFAGRNYASKAAFLAAIDATETAGAIVTNPKVVGPELIVDPGFDTGIGGWVNGQTFESLGTLSWDGPGKRLRVNVPSRSGGAVQFRCSLGVPVTVGKAYRFQLRTAQALAVGAGNAAFNPANAFGGKSNDLTVANAAGTLLGEYSSASVNPMYLSAQTNNSNVDEYWDDASVREVVPLAGHNHQALSGVVKGTTPPAASGNRVAVQADTNDERNRVRLVWDAGRHLRLIVTFNTTEQANLDLGLVEVSTPFEVWFSSTANGFKASLDGAAIVSDTSGSHPGLSHIRIGRSFSGEAWTGTIDRVTLFGAALPDAAMISPLRAFAIFGDSTAHGDGAGVALKWFDALRTAYDPDRSVYNAGVGGQDSAAMLAAVAADSAHRQWTTIFMDRPNTGEPGATWLANVKAAAGRLGTNRWLVVPPVLNSPGGLPDSSATAIAEIQSGLLADPFFAGHTFDAGQQAAYAGALDDDATRVGGGDFVHFGNAGQAIQASAIKAFLDGRGW